MKRSSISFFILSFFTFVSIQAQLVTFRIVNHCGIYSNEKNLLKE